MLTNLKELALWIEENFRPDERISLKNAMVVVAKAEGRP